jgi:hypothetical protein
VRVLFIFFIFQTIFYFILNNYIVSLFFIYPLGDRANSDVVLRIASNEVTGGFRKVSVQEVHDDYKLRLKHTKDCTKAYSFPSTITIIAAESDNVYANAAGEGRWRVIPV